jgi:hypothetical protein
MQFLWTKPIDRETIEQKPKPRKKREKQVAALIFEVRYKNIKLFIMKVFVSMARFCQVQRD